MILAAFPPVRSLVCEVHPVQQSLRIVLDSLLEITVHLISLGRRPSTPETVDDDVALCIQSRGKAEQANALLLPLLAKPSATFNMRDVEAALEQSAQIVEQATNLYARLAGIPEHEAYSLLLGKCNPLAH